MNIKTLALPLLFAALLGTGTATAYEQPCKAKGEQGLASLGLGSDDLKSVQWEERIGAGFSADGEGWVTGYNLWARPKSCERGYVVVEMTRSCYIRQIYSRGGCTIAGAQQY